jgi:plasmid stabilization system protein ParE
MAKSKIIWSNRAKKRLYGILESQIGKNTDKACLNKLQKLLFTVVKLLSKYPGLGLKTTEDTTLGLIFDDYVIYYEIKDDKILIHTICDCKQDPDSKIIK